MLRLIVLSVGSAAPVHSVLLSGTVVPLCIGVDFFLEFKILNYFYQYICVSIDLFLFEM